MKRREIIQSIQSALESKKVELSADFSIISSRKAEKSFASIGTAPEIQLRRRALQQLRHSSATLKLINDSPVGYFCALKCFGRSIEQVFGLSIVLLSVD